MTDYTKSGAMAIGDPGSLARHKNEIECFLSSAPADEENDMIALMATDEGAYWAKKFGAAVGGGPAMEPDFVMRYWQTNREWFRAYLHGVLDTMEMMKPNA